LSRAISATLGKSSEARNDEGFQPHLHDHQPEAPAAHPSGTAPVEIGTVPPSTGPDAPTGMGAGTGAGNTTTSPEVAGHKKRVTLIFEATREQVFKAFPAIANLADKSDGAKVKIR
jgi:hypothetical protein